MIRFAVRSTFLLSLVAAAALFTTSSCGSSLVGLSCKEGFSECGSACVDLRSDARNCGGCAVSCGAEEVCQNSNCVPFSQVGGDGGTDAGVDGGPLTDGASPADGSSPTDDGAVPNADGGDGAGIGDLPDGSTLPDAALPAVCQGPGSPDDCVCNLGQLKCETTCVEAAADPLHCGACDHMCGQGEVCAGGVCAPTCEAQDLTDCAGICVDTLSDPDNCGGCGIACASGLCENGECIGNAVGHVVVVGHDMSASRGAMRRLAGNAIFLPGGNPLRVLIYEEFATTEARAGVRSAIQSMASIEGRTPAVTVATSTLTVPFLMGQTDVFVVAAQASATDEELVKDGESWGRALREFVSGGGVVVLFEGGSSNAGTYTILDTAGLFSARSRITLSRRTLSLTAPSDAVASFVQLVYQSEGETVGFDTDESGVVVRDPISNLPVVVHIARGTSR
jgi:hypothetical protein